MKDKTFNPNKGDLMGTNKKANPAKTGNPKSGSDTLKDRASKDGFFTSLISHIKMVPNHVEMGVLVFIALLTNPNGSLVEYKTTGKNPTLRLDGRTVQNFIDTYKLGVPLAEFLTGIKLAGIANNNGLLKDIKLPSGKGWREAGKGQKANEERLIWIRQNVTVLGGTNTRKLSTWVTETHKDVMNGKKLTDSNDLKAVAEKLSVLGGDRKANAIAKLNGKAPAKKAPAKKDEPVVISIQDRLLAVQKELINEAVSADDSAKKLAVEFASSERNFSDAERAIRIQVLAIELAKKIRAERNSVQNS